MSDPKPKSSNTPPPSNGNPRPFPDFPRTKARRVYALIVGINDYASNVPKLSGCLKDVDLIEDYLKKEFGSEETTPTKTTIPASRAGGTALEVVENGRLHLCTLKDQQATYSNIIQAFEKHLSNANELDSVWFHFSGHGSEQFAAPEFLELDPNGKDQTLVCYKEEEDDNNQLFLADKELAVLLHKLAKKNPHIVVSLDSCHSGSGTREGIDPAGIKPRAYKYLASADREDPSLLPGSVRSLSTYYGGYSEMNNLTIPTAKHVLLSACESVQTAGDTSAGGVFTTSLMQNIRDAKAPMHYARLFTETRTTAKKKRSTQNPQFGTLDGFNPYTRFLEGDPMPETVKQYEVSKKGDNWFVHCGAINGLPVGKEELIKILINTEAADKAGQTIEVEAFIDKVGAQHSHIAPEEIESLDPDQSYFAKVISMPADPIFVKLEGEESALAALTAKWDSAKNVRIAAESELSLASITIEASAQNSFIIREATGRKFIEVPADAGDIDQRVELVLANIEKIVRWKRMIALDNPNTKIRGFFDFEVLMHEKNNIQAFGEKEVKFYGSAENLPEKENLLKTGINFQVTLTSDKQQLFFYAFDLRQNCLIRFNADEEKTITKENLEVGTKLPLRANPYTWKLLPDEDEDTRWFKLIVATEEVDYQQLEQKGLIGKRGGDDEDDEIFEPDTISNDWCTETIKVTFVRVKDEIPDTHTKSAVMADGKIKIKGHPNVNAKISLAASNAGERSNDPTNKLALFELQGHQMIDFNRSRDIARQNVLELTNIEVTKETNLEDNPLEIIISDTLGEDELMLPIAFDGENFRVIGDAVADGDETIVRIRELPEVQSGSAENPFGEEPADRSLFKALKMAFFKLVLKKTEQHKICYADYQADGSVIRRDEGVVPKVAAAKNILLLLHGIIGDTEGMAGELQHIIAPDGNSMKDHYDLVLTFDYENLNTPIQETSKKLKEALAAIGINEEDGKTLTILAHSMGGLVSRYFIESGELAGKNMVDRLILAGTPNNGSNFGKIEGARKFAIAALDMSANFFPNFIPFSGYVLKGLRTAAEVFVTLGQMDPESKFLATLNNSPDPGIPYTILGGDVVQFMEENEGDTKGMDKLLKGVGNLVNLGDENDVAVTLDSILNKVVWETRSPKPNTIEVSCHHLNYFSSKNGRKALGALLATTD